MRCLAEDCKKKAAEYTGLCSLCKGKYCMNHRLPEEHRCPYLEMARAKMREDMAKQLVDNSARPKQVEP